MGQKVNPIGIRLGISRDHNSVWYAEKNKYQQLLLNDFAVREFLKKRLDNSFVSKIEIERPSESAKVSIHTSRPGMIIGKKGEDIDKLIKDNEDKERSAEFYDTLSHNKDFEKVHKDFEKVFEISFWKS